MLQGLVKQREDSAEQFDQGEPPGARGEGARRRSWSCRATCPQEVADAEVAAAVEQAVAETGAASAKDMGKVMKAALASSQAAGKAVDGKRVNEAVRKRLARTRSGG